MQAEWEMIKTVDCSALPIPGNFPHCGVAPNDIILSAPKAYYLATMGGAKQLSVDDRIGNFEVGKEADFVVMHWTGDRPYLEDRLKEERLKGATNEEQLMEKLFVLMVMGDDRNVDATYVAGVKRYDVDDTGTTCGEVKKTYKAAGCCGAPSSTLFGGARRMSSVADIPPAFNQRPAFDPQQLHQHPRSEEQLVRETQARSMKKMNELRNLATQTV